MQCTYVEHRYKLAADKKKKENENEDEDEGRKQDRQ